MTFKFYITRGNKNVLDTACALTGLDYAEYIRLCLHRLYKIAHEFKPVDLVLELPQERNILITIGMDKELWRKLEVMYTMWVTKKTYVCYTALRNCGEDIINEFKIPQEKY